MSHRKSSRTSTFRHLRAPLWALSSIVGRIPGAAIGSMSPAASRISCGAFASIPRPRSRSWRPQRGLTPVSEHPASRWKDSPARHPSPRYHNNRAPVYPLGIDLSPDGETLYLANNLADNLGIISDLSGLRDLERVDLRPSRRLEAQPYDVVVAPQSDGHYVFVSLWATAEVVRVDPQHLSQPPVRIDVARHPTEMVVSTDGSRLYVVNSNADAVSVIGTAAGQEVERIHTGLVEVGGLVGASPEGLALSSDGARLYAANAHAATVAVIELSRLARGLPEEDGVQGEEERPSEVIGFIPTGLYPTALAVADNRLFVANGKGTGFENSSQVVSESGLFPNAPNQRYPVRDNRPRGQDIKSLTSGNLSILPEPAGPDLAAHTQTAMQANGLLGEHKTALFDGPSPIRHVIYVIKENRTYDQVFGDLEASGDGTRADGDPSLAIFGAGEAARLLGGAAQNVTPNHRLLALRFGLLDRFFVNAEASPDGHSWSTAAFSSDYIDKAFRWNYSGRGRTYDFEGFSRLPSRGPSATEPPILPLPVTAQDIADYLKRYIPYLQGAQHVAEPSSLYLWDAVLNAGLTTRNYGEFIATISAADLDAFNANRLKPYPDTSTNLLSLPTKRSLENNHCPLFRNYDLATPDVMTVDSYRAALVGGDPELAIVDPGQANEATRGSTRFSVWREEFRSFVADREAGRGDFMPNLSIVRFPNNHTSGLRTGMPTPQFMVAENDFAVGLLVQELSHSPYWRDTAVVVVEDDAQNGPGPCRRPSLLGPGDQRLQPFGCPDPRVPQHRQRHPHHRAAARRRADERARCRSRADRHLPERTRPDPFRGRPANYLSRQPDEPGSPPGQCPHPLLDGPLGRAESCPRRHGGSRGSQPDPLVLGPRGSTKAAASREPAGVLGDALRHAAGRRRRRARRRAPDAHASRTRHRARARSQAVRRNRPVSFSSLWYS